MTASTASTTCAHEDLEPYEYNITKAQMYMDIWKNSQVGTDYTLGPVGDADFSGFVEMADFFRWTEGWGEEYPFPGAR